MPKFYWTVLAYSAFEAGWSALGPDDLLPGWQAPPEEEFNFGYSDDKIDAVVEADADARAAKTAGARGPRHPGGGRTHRTRLRAVEQHGAAHRWPTSTTSWSPARGRGPRRARLGDGSARGYLVWPRRIRGRLPSTAATEGIRMDPDLDPNLQHWQDRLDSLQWVIGSIHVPGRQRPDPQTKPSQGTASARGRRRHRPRHSRRCPGAAGRRLGWARHLPEPYCCLPISAPFRFRSAD